MKRINVIGTSGSGKSTFSRKLADSLSYPYYEMDALFWKPNWGESTDEELFSAVAKVTNQPEWVLDGTYNRTVPIKWKHVDTVIWINYSFPRTIYHAIKRALNRSWTQQELWAGTGNRESFKKSFMSKDSIILWTLKTYQKNRKRYEIMMNSPDYNHINFVRLNNPKQAYEFINEINKVS